MEFKPIFLIVREECSLKLNFFVIYLGFPQLMQNFLKNLEMLLSLDVFLKVKSDSFDDAR